MITPDLDDLDTKIKASLVRKMTQRKINLTERQGSCASPYLTFFGYTNFIAT